jgi:hypothetical protein
VRAQFAELSNLKTHLTLASLRPKGTKVRQVPRGYGFHTVSCGNYFFEAIAWGAFTGLTLNWAGESSRVTRAGSDMCFSRSLFVGRKDTDEGTPLTHCPPSGRTDR